MKNWDELRTAYKVARLGKVTLAAQALNVHRSTVIRQIDALEERLGVRLFDREQSGYATTLEGAELLRVVETVEKQFVTLERQLSQAQTRRRSSLKVTSVDALSSVISPIIRRFCFKHPDVKLSYTNTNEFLRLEQGEADFAIRPGLPPKSEGYHYEVIAPIRFGLFACQKLKTKHGVGDRFEEAGTLPFARRMRPDLTSFEVWMSRHVPDANLVQQSSCVYALNDTVIDGLAAGFMPHALAAQSPHLSEIVIPERTWTIPLYVVFNDDEPKNKNCRLFLEMLKASTY